MVQVVALLVGGGALITLAFVLFWTVCRAAASGVYPRPVGRPSRTSLRMLRWSLMIWTLLCAGYVMIAGWP